MSRALLDWDVTRNPKMALQPCFCKLWFFAINIQLPFHFNWKVTFYNIFAFPVHLFFFFRLSALLYLPSSFPPTPFSCLPLQSTSSCLSLFSNLLSFFPGSLNSQIKIYLEWATLLSVLPALPNVPVLTLNLPSALWTDYPIKPNKMSLMYCSLFVWNKGVQVVSDVAI